MRPRSHRLQIPAVRCGTCRHAMTPEYKDDLLCFFGDRIITSPGCREGTFEVLLLRDTGQNKNVGLLLNGEYDEVWGDRVVDDTDVCDGWDKR
jgi:hypothetical protein